MAPLRPPGTIQHLIGADDAAGICAIYPVGGSPLKCVEERKEDGGWCSSGAGGAGGIVLAVAALLVAGARRRRHAAG